MRRSTGTYPDNWPEISRQAKKEAGWRCVRCGAEHEDVSGYRLTCHHLDMNPGNCRWWNIPPLCCACHLQIQHKVNLDRPWVMLDHSEWFKPYVAGFYAWKYLGEDLEREEVEARIDELLELEREVVLGGVV